MVSSKGKCIQQNVNISINGKEAVTFEIEIL